MIGVNFQGGSRAEGGGSSPVKSLKSLGGSQWRKGGSVAAKLLKTLAEGTEGKTLVKLTAAACRRGEFFFARAR